MKDLVILGAPSAIGIRPYDEGGMRRLDLAPDALRRSNLARRINARDLGDVRPAPGYPDLERPEDRCRNEDEVAAYAHKLAEPITAAYRNNEFIILLGGDCSILLGVLLGLRNAQAAPVGLAYIDAHADFATLAESPSHSPCSMNLALAVGRADRPLARLADDEPLVRGENVVHIGRRDDAYPAYGYPVLASFGILDLSQSEIDRQGIAGVAGAALDQISSVGGGFWIACDVDVLNPDVMPAVDTPIPGGLSFSHLTELLTTLIHHPAALGLQVTIYDPTLDPTGEGATRLAGMLDHAVAGVYRHPGDPLASM